MGNKSIGPVFFSCSHFEQNEMGKSVNICNDLNELHYDHKPKSARKTYCMIIALKKASL